MLKSLHAPTTFRRSVSYLRPRCLLSCLVVSNLAPAPRTTWVATHSTSKLRSSGKFFLRISIGSVGCRLSTPPPICPPPSRTPDPKCSLHWHANTYSCQHQS